MPLQKQKVPLELVVGVDTKTDEYNSVGFKNVENFKFSKPGSFHKRPGNIQLSKTQTNVLDSSALSNISSGEKLITSDEHLLLTNSSESFKYLSGADTWISNNKYAATSAGASIVTNSDIASTNYSETLIEDLGNTETVAYQQNSKATRIKANTNYFVTASYSTLKIYSRAEKLLVASFDIKNLGSGYDATGITTSGRGMNPIYEVFSDKVVILAQNSSGDLYAIDIVLGPTAVYVDLAGATLIGVNFLAAQYTVSSQLNADSITIGNFMYVAFGGDNEQNITLLKVAAVGHASSFISVNDATLASYNSVCINTYAGGMRVVYTNLNIQPAANGIRHFGRNTSLVQTYAPVSLPISVAGPLYVRGATFVSDGTQSYFFTVVSPDDSPLSGTYVVSGVSSLRTINVTAITDSSNTTVLVRNVFYDIFLQQKPAIIGNRIIIGATPLYGLFSFKSNSTFFLLSVNKTTLQSTLAGTAAYLDYVGYLPGSTNPNNGWREFVVEGSKVHTLIVKNTEVRGSASFAPAYGPSNFSQIYLSTFDFGATAVTSAISNRETIIAGSAPKLFDKRQVAELGFVEPPFIYGYSVGTGAAPNFSAATYGFAVVYKWVDNLGLIHRSAPAFQTVVISGSTTTAFSILTSVPVTTKYRMSFELYVTQPNGIIYNHQQTVFADPFPTVRVNFNFTYVAGTTTGVVPDSEVLYTLSGELENDFPTSYSYLTSFKNRLWGINDNSLEYSKLIEDGAPVTFNETLKINTDLSGGPNTALAPMDNVLVLFKQRAIYIISGEGPNNLGQQGDFGIPQLITADVGCVEPASITNSAEGVFFKSHKGIYMLNRGLYVSYIGAPVEDYNQYTVLKAVLVSNTNEVRFTLSNGKVLSYDYYVKQWDVSGTYTNAVDMAVKDNELYLLKSDGSTWKESSTTFTDNGTYYSGILETNWITVSGVNGAGAMARGQQGFERLYAIHLLGKYKSAHNLSVGISYNYVDTIIDTAIVVPSPSAPYQYEVRPSIQKCESFKLTITDVSQSGTGESLVLSGMLLEIGIKGTAQRVTGDSSRFPAT